MKQNIFSHLLLLLGACCTACSEDFAEENKGETPLSLTASAQELVLDEREASQTALTLTWTTGTNHGTGAAIDYTLEIAPEGTEYADGYVEQLGRRIYERSFSVSDLNDFLQTQFAAQAGPAALYRARVTALAAGTETPQTAETTFTATPYEPVTRTLYLIGDATPNGWSADNATEMKRVQAGLFTWQGRLNAGEFKFITTLGQFSPAYMKDPNAEDGCTLIYNDEADVKFSIAEAGGYMVTADLLNLRLELSPIDLNEPPYKTLFFVSEANGWSFEPMTQDPVNPFIFRYGAEIGNGQFKFGTSAGSWENMYKTDTDNAPYTNTTVVFVAGFDPDCKWFLWEDTPNKPFKIALDITPDHESMVMTEFTPYPTLWMVGDATPNGWSLDDATPLDNGGDAYTFTWTGRLNKGELKFTCDRDSSWNGAWFMASENNKPFAEGSETVTFVDKQVPENGSIDRKWVVETAGDYTITLNQLTETMTVSKQ